MCGIFGYYAGPADKPADLDVLRAMADALRHRGPDDEGFLVDPPVGLGMRRLSIIDLKSGHQPIQNEDGSVQIVFNGEIYNYRELAQDLLRRGHTLSTTSDTEVIVHLYEEYGSGCVHHLRGMFAFAIWDRRRRTLLLARDRLGIKPLYYFQEGAELVFASEPKAILRFPGFRREISPHGVLHYLRYGYVPDPLSIWRNVWKLPPGHYLTLREDGIPRLTRYWDLRPAFAEWSPPVSEADAVEELRWRLAETVKLHLVSDVPLGAFLSGGIDSSTVLALMAEELGRSIKTFSIGFKEESFNELPYARAAARRFGTEHHELVVGPDSVDLIERLVEAFDEPFADASAIPTYFVSRLAREHVKVVLSGDGGDELFAGYDRYVVDARRRAHDIVPWLGLGGLVRAVGEALPEGALGKNYLFQMSLPRMDRYLENVSHFPPRRLRQLLTDDLWHELGSGPDAFEPHITAGRSLDFTSRLQYLDAKTYLPGDILTKVDRMSMVHSLEARVPLLDHTLVEFAARLPSRYKLHGKETKYIFKRAIGDRLPSEILTRPKQGFAVPLQYWFREGLQDYLRDNLVGRDALPEQYFKPSVVETLLNIYLTTGKADYLSRLWTLLVFAVWHRVFVREKR